MHRSIQRQAGAQVSNVCIRWRGNLLIHISRIVFATLGTVNNGRNGNESYRLALGGHTSRATNLQLRNGNGSNDALISVDHGNKGI